MFILCVGMVSAITAGTTESIYHFDECDSLRVDITGDLQIDIPEYELIGCDETSLNSWYCDCENDYDLLLKTKFNTINNYTFNIMVNFSHEVPETTNSRSPSNPPTPIINTFNPNTIEPLYIFPNSQQQFVIGGNSHTARIISQTDNSAIIEFRSTPVQVELSINETKQVEIDNVLLDVTLVSLTNNYIKLEIIESDKVISTITPTTISPTTTTTIPGFTIDNETDWNESYGDRIITVSTSTTSTTLNEGKNDNSQRNRGLMFIAIGLAILLIITYLYLGNKKNKVK